MNNGLICAQGHFFPYLDEFKIPCFFVEDMNATDYSNEDAVKIHDNAFEWVYKTFNSSEHELRSSLVNRLNLKKGQTILVTGAGSGHDLPYVMEALEYTGQIYAQDISKFMLIDGARRFSKLNKDEDLTINFSLSDATNLPFQDSSFDAVYHFGGINLFTSIKKGIDEMSRVVKTGGRVLFCDEGIAPWLKQTELGRMLIKNNQLLDFEPPLQFLPPTAYDVKLSWELSNSFYVIDFCVCDTDPKINIDVPHKGKRGGTIRKRYLGQLEGIDPKLRKILYEKAENLNMSRVDYLESILVRGLEVENE